MKKKLAVLLALIMIPISAQTYFADEFSAEVTNEEVLEQVSEDETKPKKLVALGDSITRGYGLAEDEKSYVDILTEEGCFESNNFAVNGRTSVVLLESLQKPSENEKQALEQADYIVMSIGGNDMLYLLNNLVDGVLPSDSMSNPAEAIENLVDMANKLTPENMKSDIAYYKSTVEKIIKLLQKMNPKAEIVMQTVYDPFKPVFVVAPVVFSYMESDINYAYERVESCIDGFNTSLFELSEKYGFKIADVSKDFKKSDKKYINMSLSNPDIHPNAAGHRRIAEIVEQTIDPNGAVFTSAASSDKVESDTGFEKSNKSEKFSTNSDKLVENSATSKPSEGQEMSYTQRLLIFVGIMAVISFVVTFSRLKHKSKK